MNSLRMKKIGVIPARMGSSRFPGKPLVDVLGVPMVVHIARRCQGSLLDHVVVATCDAEIEMACQNAGIPCVMTDVSHERCTDRVSEAIEKMGMVLQDQDLVLMIQGDEIFVDAEMIARVIAVYKEKKPHAVNLLSRIRSVQDHEDPNVVKVVFSPDGQALYLSRAPIPSRYRAEDAPLYQQTGLIGFSRKFLRTFHGLPQTPLEKIESIDMLRLLEHHIPLDIVCIEKETIAVDVPGDLARALKILKQEILEQEPAYGT